MVYCQATTYSLQVIFFYINVVLIRVTKSVNLERNHTYIAFSQLFMFFHIITTELSR